MLKHSILPKKTKIIGMMVIAFLIIYMCTNGLLQAKVNAQSIENYSESRIEAYPGYKELINNLKAKYPNWQFKILYTGLDWNQVIKNETTVVHGKNLVYSDKSGAWICSICGDKHYDNGSWRCASEATVSYYMDPRNWINEDYIFQFENLAYDSKTQNIDGVNKIIANAPWMKGSSITYTKTDGTTGTINKSYAQIIMEASQAANISAYHLAARIVQEQGSGSSASSTACGNYGGYKGYYNYCNIGAIGNSSSAVITRAITYARDMGWTDPETAIKGAAAYIARNYISVGQSTLYLQKFDVDNTDSSLYNHQYMQNVSAAVSESSSVRSSYAKLNILNSNFTFVIPVYENMPENRCASPDSASVVTQNVRVTGNEVQVRNAPSLLGTVITKVNTGDVLLRIECATSQNGGYYWDRVVLPSGVKGYIARNYLEQIEDVTNANITAVTNTSVNLRNAPGIIGTNIVTTLIYGQTVTIIEKDKYNGINDFNWVKVQLSNGTKGYIADKYLTIVGESTPEAPANNNNSSNYILATVTCDDGSSVRLRASATTSSSVVTSLAKGAQVTVMQENVANSDGFSWDKIVTSDGLEGYIANRYLNKPNNKPNSNNNSEAEGDIDGDGCIDSGDLYEIVAGLKNNQSYYRASADINKDNVVDSEDIYLLIQILKR